jgi:hypothetical protein
MADAKHRLPRGVAPRPFDTLSACSTYSRQSVKCIFRIQATWGNARGWAIALYTCRGNYFIPASHSKGSTGCLQPQGWSAWLNVLQDFTMMIMRAVRQDDENLIANPLCDSGWHCPTLPCLLERNGLPPSPSNDAQTAGRFSGIYHLRLGDEKAIRWPEYPLRPAMHDIETVIRARPSHDSKRHSNFKQLRSFSSARGL